MRRARTGVSSLSYGTICALIPEGLYETIRIYFQLSADIFACDIRHIHHLSFQQKVIFDIWLK